VNGRISRLATLALLLVFAIGTTPVDTQTLSRVATTRALLLSNSLFFHSRTVAIVDTPRLIDGVWKLPAEKSKTLVAVFRTAPTRDGAVEIRGTFIDLGRFAPTDSRIVAFGLQPVIDAIVGPGGPWPARETVFVIANATATPVVEDGTATLRNIALYPDKFDGKPVTLRGRFRGRNLFGDLPSWPRQGQWDFVLQAADGALWVTGLRPRGKGFELDPNARKDSGRWLEVSGSVGLVEGQPVLKALTILAAAPEEEPVVADDRPAPPPLPPPTISFSAPTEGETDIPPATPIRVQFSRDMKESTFEKRIRVTCTVNGAVVETPAMTATYRPATLAVELKFASPLPRFAKVVVEFLEGITAPDGTPLAPTTLTFSTAG
jgi:hypothetical protein